MKHWLAMATLALSCSAAVAEESAATKETLEQQAQSITAQFGGQLKALLQANMIAGGPVQAMQVCRTNAPAIARSVSEQQGWQVARTSLKVRNPANTPDAWERKVLEEWVDKIQRGAPVANLKSSEIITENGASVYRYMQAIPTAELCLNCHGSQLSSQVRDALKSQYPQDQATGFKVGDLRGAFTLQKSL